jgi:hypothetical protein
MMPTDVTDRLCENSDMTSGTALASVSNEPKNQVTYDATDAVWKQRLFYFFKKKFHTSLYDEIAGKTLE